MLQVVVLRVRSELLAELVPSPVQLFEPEGLVVSYSQATAKGHEPQNRPNHSLINQELHAHQRR